MASSPMKVTTYARRPLSSAIHFYRNKQLELYASKETKRLTLRQLVGSLFDIVDALSLQQLPGLLWEEYERGQNHQGNVASSPDYSRHVLAVAKT
jgi:hypothetical protein